jgi:hypothetical protein
VFINIGNEATIVDNVKQSILNDSILYLSFIIEQPTVFFLSFYSDIVTTVSPSVSVIDLVPIPFGEVTEITFRKIMLK